MSQAVQLEVGSSANSYAILAKLATGGMAELFLARNASAAGIERYVVLKRVLAQRANDEAFVRMFLDEARLVAQLQHPNIAQVYDTGVLGDSYFFTMEYVHGETVREIMHRAYDLEQTVPVACALTIVAAAAAGLHHAHERIGIDGKPLHIVHRDVSPSNLMVSYEGQVKVVDFGVAKANARSSGETHSGTVKGKIAYLSPEQCRGRPIDRRSDLFSLGIVLWELIAGDRLWQRETDYEIMDAIVKEPAPSLRERRADVPLEIDAIVQKLLAKEPADRYQTCDELLEEIENAAMKTGQSLSVASLARFMRELFGQRPEPWVQMGVRDTRAEAVTVTASPAMWSGGGGAEVTSAQLAQLPDISTRSGWPESSMDALATTLARSPETASVSEVRAPKRRTIVMLSLAVAVGIAVVAGLLVMQSGAGEAQPAAPPPAAPVAAITPPAAPAPAPAVVIDAAAAEPAVPEPAVPEPTVAEPTVPPAPVASPEPPPAAVAHPVHHVARVSPTDELAKACHAHDAVKARHLLTLVPASKRASLTVECELAGTPLDAPKPPPPSTTVKTPPKSTTPDCDADPMACRH